MPPWAWTLAAQLVNVAILVFLLKRFLYKPVRKILAERRRKVQDQLDGAARTASEAATKLAEYERKVSASDAEVDTILAQGREKASSLVEEAVAEASRQALEYRERAARDLEKETAAAAVKLRGKILDVSLALAARLVSASGDRASALALAADLAAKVKALPEGDAKAVGEASSAVLRTSHDLGGEGATLVKDALDQRLGRPVELLSKIDPSLILGVELEAGGLAVRSHVAARLKEARDTLESPGVMAELDALSSA